MAGIEARNAVLVVNYYDVTAQANDLTLSAGATTEDATHYGSVAEEFVPTILTWSLDYKGFFQGAGLASDLEKVAEAMNGAVGLFAACPAGDTVSQAGTPAYAGYSTHMKVNLTAPVKGIVRLDISAKSSGQRDVSVVLHSRAAAVTGNGPESTYYDNLAAASKGIVAYLFVIAVSGGTLTAKVAHSTDHSTWADLATFTAASTPGVQRITTSGTVNRYLRADWTLTGGSATFLELVHINS